MQILVAPNAFKNSLAARDVALAIEQGLKESRYSGTVQCFPVGDGGDGTGELLLYYCNGQVFSAIAHDPLGRQISCSFGLIEKGRSAVIEMTSASGLRLLKPSEFDPLHASSIGTGELICEALNKGAREIILCIGGSATVDGGTGILLALGFRFVGKNGKEIRQLPDKLSDIQAIDGSDVDERIKECKIIVLCDVENYLLGAQGAAAVFGPQKGASPRDVAKLELGLSRLRDVLLDQTGRDMATVRHGGAAGGVAAALAILLNAELVNGIDYFLMATKFDSALDKADLVITGEGSIDLQTVGGKGPFGVAMRAKENGRPVIALAGQIPSETVDPLNRYFDAILSINSEPMDVTQALAYTKENLVRTARAIGDVLSLHGAIAKNSR